MQKFYYAKYKSDEPIYDEWGNLTSEHNVIYGNPIEARGNVSAAKGETEIRQFGESDDYDKVIVVSTTDIDEHCVLWVDRTPELSPEGMTDTAYDYVVRKVAKSLNSVSISIKKVDVS